MFDGNNVTQVAAGRSQEFLLAISSLKRPQEVTRLTRFGPLIFFPRLKLPFSSGKLGGQKKARRTLASVCSWPQLLFFVSHVQAKVKERTRGPDLWGGENLRRYHLPLSQ